MKKIMFVSVMFLMLATTLVSAWEVENYEVTYNKKTNEATVNYDVVLDDECTPNYLSTYIFNKKDNLVQTLTHGRNAIQICYISDHNGNVLWNRKKTGTFHKEYTFQLDEKLKNKNLLEARLMAMPRGTIIPGGRVFEEVSLTIIK